MIFVCKIDLYVPICQVIPRLFSYFLLKYERILQTTKMKEIYKGSSVSSFDYFRTLGVPLEEVICTFAYSYPYGIFHFDLLLNCIELLWIIYRFASSDQAAKGVVDYDCASCRLGTIVTPWLQLILGWL